LILCALVPEDIEAQIENSLLRLTFRQESAKGAPELRMVTDINHRHCPQNIRLLPRPYLQAVGPKKAAEANDVSS